MLDLNTIMLRGYDGLRVQSCSYMSDSRWMQFRFPRSKKQRIRKKWSKDRRNSKLIVTPWRYFIQVGSVLYGHSSLIEELFRLIDGQYKQEQMIFGTASHFR